MLTSAVFDNPTWRMAIHSAVHGYVQANFRSFFFRKTTEPFSIADIKGVIGLSETPSTDYFNVKATVFRGVVVLQDKRYAYFEATRIVDDRAQGDNKIRFANVKTIYTRDLNSLLSQLSAETIEKLKIDPKRILNPRKKSDA